MTSFADELHFGVGKVAGVTRDRGGEHLLRRCLGHLMSLMCARLDTRAAATPSFEEAQFHFYTFFVLFIFNFFCCFCFHILLLLYCSASLLLHLCLCIAFIKALM